MPMTSATMANPLMMVVSTFDQNSADSWNFKGTEISLDWTRILWLIYALYGE